MSDVQPAFMAAVGAGSSTDAAMVFERKANSFDDSGRALKSEGFDSRWRELFPIPLAEEPCTCPGASCSSRRRRAKVRDRVRLSI